MVSLKTSTCDEMKWTFSGAPRGCCPACRGLGSCPAAAQQHVRGEIHGQDVPHPLRLRPPRQSNPCGPFPAASTQDRLNCTPAMCSVAGAAAEAWHSGTCTFHVPKVVAIALG